jgi:hypothetical protein
MIVSTRRAAIALAGFALLATSLSASDSRADSGANGLADGKADGTITVNGKKTKVAFTYARFVPGIFDKNVNDIQVIVSDVALDAKAQADQFTRIRLGDSGKLHAFEIVVKADGAPVSTAWRHNGFKGPQPSGLSTEDVFTKNVLDDKVIEGSYKSAKDGEFFGNAFSFDVSFRAAIAH